jgi:hypothetical protein
LDNISEEFSLRSLSHEELYFKFADEFGVDLNSETITEENYLPFLKKFNKSHTDFLLTEGWNTKWATFSAYEKLDNVDYKNLLNLAKNIGTSAKGMVFFRVHSEANHHDSTSQLLQKIWETDPESVKIGFEFIAKHQLEMWKELEVELS